ncbi:hypothetical protein P175DRAFT_0342056 [Aspergillus ochraceoroseus IBT 24754]|uniref:Uncharacterized protein n=1 Tax=Aspergillus ochraceoroseus IBT 24754 TaxID=1392256 RepID=A0A2T5LRV6_9EURO|nr:uncharacterized protein P175DRAFT_0342056 [Aspergillus ochraceoroseus IBT 24754]PTU19014.1 hypothetical protein P175DRAFT_0342056 [Aspergillus ochraceoroseus IBT 24754]
MERGQAALLGQEEKDIPSHRFPPHPTSTRIIHFKGEYLSIYNEKTEHRHTFKENIAEFTSYEIPPGYTCYIRGASVYFQA